MITQMVQVTYRATAASGRDAELRFVADPAQATIGDAWSRLSALHPGIDPMSLEIELRELQPGSAFQPTAFLTERGLENGIAGEAIVGQRQGRALASSGAMDRPNRH